MTRNEIDSEILALSGLLSQTDYTARKVAFEVAKIVKQLHPEVDMPSLEQYLETEEKAQSFRDRINELKEMTPDDENQE